MASNTIEYLIKIRDEASAALKDLEKEAGGASEGLGKVEKSSESMTKSMVKAQAVIGAAKIAFNALKAATVDFGAGAIQAGSQMEGFGTRLEVLMGSAGAAQERLDELFLIGSTTPFELPGLIEAEVNLRALGVSAEDNLPLIMDFAGAMGVDVSRAAVEVGRAMQFGAGAVETIAGRALRAQVELKTGQDALKMSTEEFRQALIDTLTDPKGIFAGGTEKLAATFDGMLSNLRDSWFKFQKDVGDAELFGTAKDTLGITLGLLGDNAKVTQQWATIVGTGLSAGMLLFAEGLSKAGQGILLLFSSLQELVILAVKTSEEMNKFLPDFLAVGQGLPSMAAAEEALQLTIDTAAALSVFDKEVDKLQEDINRLGQMKIGVPDRPTGGGGGGGGGGGEDITWKSEVSVEVELAGKRAVDPLSKSMLKLAESTGSLEDALEEGTRAAKEEQRSQVGAAIAGMGAAMVSALQGLQSLSRGSLPGKTWWGQMINLLAQFSDPIDWGKLEQTIHDAFIGAVRLFFDMDAIFAAIVDGVVFGIRDAFGLGQDLDEQARREEPSGGVAIDTAIAWLNQKLSFQTGSKFVDRTGLAFLHRGEQVTPAGGATPSRGFGGGGSGGLVVNVNAPLGIGPGTAEQLVRELNAILGARGLNLSVA